MTNGSCPLVFACLQKSRRRFEHTYTVVHGSVNNFAIDRMWLLKTFAVGFFGTSTEVERCHLTDDNFYIVITLTEKLEAFLFCFSHKYFCNTLFLSFL